MREPTQIADVERAAPERVDLEQFASYEADDGFVICDRTNPKAWIKSTTAPRVER